MSKATPSPVAVLTELERLQSEDEALRRREAEAAQKLAALKARLEAIDGEVGAAAARGDDAALAALAAELDALPSRVKVADASYRGIGAAREPVSRRLAELNRERIVSTLDEQGAELVVRGGQSADAFISTLVSLGRMVVDRNRLCDEMDAFRKHLAAYGRHAAPLPRPHELAEAAFVRARSAGRVEAAEVRIPVPV